jgi:Bacteriophage lambda head decoration protein D
MVQYATFSQPNRQAEWLISEGRHTVSRDTAIAAVDLPSGAAVAILSTPLPGGGNGAELNWTLPAQGIGVPVGIVLRDVKAGDTAVYIARLAEVNGALLVYGPGNGPLDAVLVKQMLEANHQIVVR